MSSNLNWESFYPLFGTWAERFKPFFESGGFDPIYERLKTDSGRGRKIAPLSENVFKCFQTTPIDDVKVVMMGLSPYHTFYNNAPVADGLLMSCSITGKLQPSLIKFYDAIEEEFGKEIIRVPDLSYLAEQGVLLTNASLTTEMNKPGNHISLWEPFIKYLFEEVLITNGVPVVLLGKEAQKMKKYIMPFTWIFELSHPASASYNNTSWDSENVFHNVNKILKDNNKTEIIWQKTD